MERRVIKGFTDKETKEKHPRGSKYNSQDAERVNELVSKGYLSGEESKPVKEKKVDPEDAQMGEVKAEEMTMAELKQVADDEGLEVIGTGKNGAIKKEDYIKALEK